MLEKRKEHIKSLINRNKILKENLRDYDYDEEYTEITKLSKHAVDLELEILSDTKLIKESYVPETLSKVQIKKLLEKRDYILDEIENYLNGYTYKDETNEMRYQYFKKYLEGINKQLKAFANQHSEAKPKKDLTKHPFVESGIKKSVSLFSTMKVIRDYFMDTLGIPVEVVRNEANSLKVIVPSYVQGDNDEVIKIDSITNGLNKSFAESEELIGGKIRLSFVDFFSTCFMLYFDPTEPGNYYNLFESNLEETEETITEVTKSDIGDAISDSNLVLDKKFIWVFTVVDKYSETIKDNIFDLEKAISVFVDEEPKATMIVAYPYIDPNPEDDDVELVFADNPGPIILFNTEKVTHTKKKEYDLKEDELKAIEAGEEDLGKGQLEEKSGRSIKKTLEEAETHAEDNQVKEELAIFAKTPLTTEDESLVVEKLIALYDEGVTTTDEYITSAQALPAQRKVSFKKLDLALLTLLKAGTMQQILDVVVELVQEAIRVKSKEWETYLKEFGKVIAQRAKTLTTSKTVQTDKKVGLKDLLKNRVKGV